MPMSYPGSLRQSIAERLVAGEPVTHLAKESAISAATLYRWKRQLRVDVGLRPGLKSVEDDQVRRLARRVKTLEHELDLVKTASRLSNELEVIDPKGSSRSSRHSATGASVRAKRAE